MPSNRTTFDEVPDDNDNVAFLGSLVADRRETFGPKAIFFLDQPCSHPHLARDLLAALDEHVSFGEISSDATYANYGKAVRGLLQYCSARGYRDSLRMRDVDLEFLLDYRRHLRVRLSEFKSAYRRRLFGDLLRLLQAGQALGFVSEELQFPRNFTHVKDSDVTQPYTAGEALDIEDACRNHIQALNARLDLGETLLQQGKDPRAPAARDPQTGRILAVPFEQRAWNQLPNLLWYVVHEMGGTFIKYTSKHGHSSFTNATSHGWQGAHTKKDVFSHLYPLSEDLIPFLILLAKATGRNECSLTTLRRDCLQELNGRYILWYRKERGGDRLYRKVIANDSPWSPVALIQMLQRITSKLTTQAKSEHRDYLFLGLTIRGRGLDPVKPVDATYFKYQMNHEGGWCDQNELFDQAGRPLRISFRRLRVFYLTKRYKKHGQLGRVTRDAAHRLSRTTVSYVDNDSTKHVHEQAIENGIRAARQLAQPTVLETENIFEAAQALGVPESTVEKVVRGEQDVFFASCRDFYNRPGGLPDTPCDKPWGCFFCSNAIITRHVLPRVIAFRDFVLKQQLELSAQDWNLKFGEVWQILMVAVLPKFSPEAIAEAERQAVNEIFYIPLSVKV
ncbi:phage integrase [Burkholderia pseudomallei]|nr:phage integrase [Burkholderia pseudomallei]